VYGLTLVTPPAEEPVTLDELKRWLRLEGEDDNPLVSALGAAARAEVERLLGRQLMPASWRLTLDGFPWPQGWAFLESPVYHPDPYAIRLPKAPLQSVSSVEYYDLADQLQVLAPSRYVVDAAHDPGRLCLAMGQHWPVTRPRPGAVRVAFTAGYASAAAVPEGVKLAIKMAAAFWYEHRGDGAEDRALPGAAKALLASQWNGEREYGL
jgi:uncharacterized phiE125 gp8 family phage protein